jgi:hypothetical protein
MALVIHPSDAISDGVCAVCGYFLDGETAFFAVSLESVITRQTHCPPLHQSCAVGEAKSKLSVHAVWESGYTFDALPEPIFHLEKSVRPLEFDGKGDCTREGISKALGAAWLGLLPVLGEDAERMGQSAARLLPGRPVDFAALDLSKPRREVMA